MRKFNIKNLFDFSQVSTEAEHTYVQELAQIRQEFETASSESWLNLDNLCTPVQMFNAVQVNCNAVDWAGTLVRAKQLSEHICENILDPAYFNYIDSAALRQNIANFLNDAKLTFSLQGIYLLRSLPAMMQMLSVQLQTPALKEALLVDAHRVNEFLSNQNLTLKLSFEKSKHHRSYQATLRLLDQITMNPLEFGTFVSSTELMSNLINHLRQEGVEEADTWLQEPYHQFFCAFADAWRIDPNPLVKVWFAMQVVPPPGKESIFKEIPFTLNRVYGMIMSSIMQQDTVQSEDEMHSLIEMAKVVINERKTYKQKFHN